MANVNFQNEIFSIDDPTLDIRLARVIQSHETIKSSEGDKNETHKLSVYPYKGVGTFTHQIQEPAGAIQQQIDELEGNDNTNASETEKASAAKELEYLKKRKEYLLKFAEDNSEKYIAPPSLINPYALIKLHGASGKNYYSDNVLFDNTLQRRYYETDGDKYGGYAKNPTTTSIVNWSKEDPRGRFTYSFQDFLFCKHWHKVPNNRLITLRRFAAPTTDNLEPMDYDGKTTQDEATQSVSSTLTRSSRPYAPIATAVTYFGETTENKLSDLLSFSFKYNWKDLHAEKSPIDVTSEQNDEGNVIGNSSNVGASLTNALTHFSHIVGFANDMQGKGTPPWYAAANMPPDPYSNGPYENRILGPINVILDTWKRERGLEFTHDSIKINFEYVARPMKNVNNKAVLLDLLANILTLTYSSGTWFGGMWRYRCEHPAVYPWQYGDVMSRMYKGKIFGKEGAPNLLFDHMQDNIEYIGSVFGDLIKSLANNFKNLMGSVADALFGDGTSVKQKSNEKDQKAENTVKKISGAVEKMIARRALKGAAVPYLNNQKALLTGDSVGDWHLTIGNPMNPIATIGNLIVTNTSIKFSDELGPDDFPIGFTATIELKHGLGRDRDAIESMFNRGSGRIYALPDNFRTSADGETKVDQYTGTNGEVRTKYEETSNKHWGGGFRYIMKTETSQLKNTGASWDGELNNYTSLMPGERNATIAQYYASPWQMAMNL